MTKPVRIGAHAEPLRPAAPRACAYLRVSTGRQAESDLSIPDQGRQVEAYAARQGWMLTATYVDPGVSGREEERAEFQRMIERACDEDRPFDIVMVHSFSRFFRDAFGLEMYVRKLAKCGVRLVSITQELGEDPAQVMMRQIIALFDEYQSRENAKNTLRAMKENARQGFYNGSPVPLGYTTAVAEMRGGRAKKKLVIEPVEAETVRLVFRLYHDGDGTSGPLGVKAVTCWLNERGYRTRRGARFGVASVHTILTNTVYVGRWIFNKRSSRTLREKPASEQVVVAVPALIDTTLFEAVGATLKAHDPRVTAPRVVSGPILLTGLAVCASCAGAMTLRTGTSKSGTVHRYYTCSTCARMGKTACKGRSVPMAKLDALVTDHLAARLFEPRHLTALLASVVDRRAAETREVDGRSQALQAETTAAEGKLKRLYDLVESGTADLDDLLRERIATLRAERDRARTAWERIQAQSRPTLTVASDAIVRFGEGMRAALESGGVPFRKAYIRSVVDRIEVDDDVIRIVGDLATLEQAIAGHQTGQAGVRSSVRKWRTRQDSNL